MDLLGAVDVNGPFSDNAHASLSNAVIGMLRDRAGSTHYLALQQFVFYLVLDFPNLVHG